MWPINTPSISYPETTKGIPFDIYQLSKHFRKLIALNVGDNVKNIVAGGRW